MEHQVHALAAHDLPAFITAPGETDTLLVISAVILLVAVVSVGVLYFNLHALPERISHRTNKVQLELVAVLALLALFTHNHLFWIIALLLAFIRVPDYETPLNTISDSLRRLAGGVDNGPGGRVPPVAEGGSHGPAPAQTREHIVIAESRRD